MSVNLMCSECKISQLLMVQLCKGCGYDFNRGLKYRVVVRGHDGKRIYEKSYVPDKAKRVLSRHDDRSQHYEIKESITY